MGKIIRSLIPILWTLSFISFFVGMRFCSIGERKVPEGLEESMWGAGFCLSSQILAILAVIVMVTVYLNSNNIDSKFESKRDKLEVPTPVNFLEEE